MGAWDCFCGAKEGEPCKCPEACNAADKLRQERNHYRKALEFALSILGPKAGCSRPMCDGCKAEWEMATDVLREAINQHQNAGEKGNS